MRYQVEFTYFKNSNAAPFWGRHFYDDLLMKQCQKDVTPIQLLGFVQHRRTTGFRKTAFGTTDISAIVIIITKKYNYD